VLEFDSLAQVEDQARAAVLDVPALGELRPDGEIRIEPHQRIKDEIENLPLGVFDRKDRIERLDVRRKADRERPSTLRRLGRRRVEKSRQEAREKRDEN